MLQFPFRDVNVIVFEVDLYGLNELQRGPGGRILELSRGRPEREPFQDQVQRDGYFCLAVASR